MSKLYFKNEVGKIYDDKIVIKTSKFPFNETTEILIANIIDKRVNILFLIISISFLILALLDYVFRYYFLSGAIFFLILTISKKNYKSFIQVKKININECANFKIKYNKKQQAKEFVNKASLAIKNSRNPNDENKNTKLKNENYKFK